MLEYVAVSERVAFKHLEIGVRHDASAFVIPCGSQFFSKPVITL